MAKGKRCWIDMEAELKECSVCGEVLPFSSFYKNKKNKHGLVGHCIECDRKGWHVDHIKPLAIFDLTDRQQFLEACHYTNLQPLWAEDNLAKGDR